MATTDVVQKVREAVVGVLDTRAGIVALTGRPSGNVVPLSSLGTGARPLIAFAVVTAAQIGGTGDTRRMVVQFTAVAADDDDATVNALMEQVELGFTVVAFAALPIPLDAYVEDRQRQYVGDDAARADIDVTLIVTK